MPIKPLKGGIIKSKVLPGFQFRREDLFNKPSPKEMIADKVYKKFVLPDLTTKQKVEEEKWARLQAEAEAFNEKRARLQAEAEAFDEKRARLQAEAETEKEKRAKLQAEAEIAHLKALLEKLQKAR